MADVTPPALNPFGPEGDVDTDRDRGQAVDVSAAAMSRMRTPFASGDVDRAAAVETDRHRRPRVTGAEAPRVPATGG